MWTPLEINYMAFMGYPWYLQCHMNLLNAILF